MTEPIPTASTRTSAVFQLTLFVVLLGALAGVLIAVVTTVVSRSQIGGEGWSLSGNGALVVPLALTPAALAGGWVGLARWSRRDGRWGVSALASGGAALIAAGLLAFGPVIAVAALGDDALSGGADALTALALTFLLPLGMAFVDGVALALAFGTLRRKGVVLAVALLALSLLLIVLAPGMFFVAGPLALVPLLVSGPLLASGVHKRGVSLTAPSLAVPTATARAATAPAARPLLSGRVLAAVCAGYTAATAAGIYAAQQVQMF